MWFSGRSASSALRGGKGLLKVGDEILDVFNADGDADEIGRYAEFLLQFRRMLIRLSTLPRLTANWKSFKAFTNFSRS